MNRIQTDNSGKDSKGRFVKGNKCAANHRNRNASRKELFANAIAKAVRVEDIKKIIQAQVKKAKKGNIKAAELVLESGYGKVKQEVVVDLRYCKTKDSGKAETKNTPDIKDRFSFNEAQAFFDGRDLDLPSGQAVEILKNLVDSFGQVVKHKNLHSESTPTDASDFLRSQITIFRKALKKHKVPCKIQTKRGVGYVLSFR